MANVAMEAVTVIADGQVHTGKGEFYGVCMAATGNAVIHDGTDTNGAVICAASIPGTNLGGNYVKYNTGLYVNLTTAVAVTVYFTRR